MIIVGIIAAALAVLLSVAGFVIITIGLWKSFARDAFNRAIYLGLALISTAAIIFALSGPIFVGGLIFDIMNNKDDDPVASAPVHDEPAVVEEDSVEEVIVEDGPFPETFIPAIYSSTGGELECTSSDEADNFMISFFDQPQITGSGSTYVVADSDTTGYIITETLNGPSIVYVDTYTYQISAANDVAYDNTYLVYPEDDGLEPIDTDSEAFQVAEGCVS